HRPWNLDRSIWPSDLGILAYHLAFDEGLTLGFNPCLAAVLELNDIEILGTKEGRPIGMTGQVPTHSFDWYCDRLTTEFHGLDAVRSYPGEISKIAVVGAMTNALVREAADRNIHLYITGQLRKAAELALQETGLGCIAVGHQRSEVWGLRSLAQILQQRWPHLVIVCK
ncbi:MAG TPA: Nif3-like dinuclear metal center hexameric protein, partial [Crinalium sp.]